MARKKGRRPKPPGTQRVGLTVKLEPGVRLRLKRAAYWLRQDVTAIVEALVVAKLAEMEGEHGGPFEPVPGE
jgi:hypothetical protein